MTAQFVLVAGFLGATPPVASKAADYTQLAASQKQMNFVAYINHHSKTPRWLLPLAQPKAGPDASAIIELRKDDNALLSRTLAQAANHFLSRLLNRRTLGTPPSTIILTTPEKTTGQQAAMLAASCTMLKRVVELNASAPCAAPPALISYDPNTPHSVRAAFAGAGVPLTIIETPSEDDAAKTRLLADLARGAAAAFGADPDPDTSLKRKAGLTGAPKANTATIARAAELTGLLAELAPDSGAHAAVLTLTGSELKRLPAALHSKPSAGPIALAAAALANLAAQRDPNSLTAFRAAITRAAQQKPEPFDLAFDLDALYSSFMLTKADAQKRILSIVGEAIAFRRRLAALTPRELQAPTILATPSLTSPIHAHFPRDSTRSVR